VDGSSSEQKPTFTDRNEFQAYPEDKQPTQPSIGEYATQVAYKDLQGAKGKISAWYRKNTEENETL